MGKWTAERWAAAAGIAFVALSVIGDALPGSSYPRINDDAATISAYFRDHSRAIAAGSVLTGAAAPLFVWLFATVASRLRAAGQGAFALVALAALIAGTALATASDAVLQAMVRVGTDNVSKGAYATSGFLITKAFWFAAVAALAIGLAALRGAFARWYAWSSFAAGALFALGALTVTEDGILRVAGPTTLVAFVALLVWVLATSAALWTEEST
jgi:hypothetical protein